MCASCVFWFVCACAHVSAVRVCVYVRICVRVCVLVCVYVCLRVLFIRFPLCVQESRILDRTNPCDLRTQHCMLLADAPTHTHVVRQLSPPATAAHPAPRHPPAPHTQPHTAASHGGFGLPSPSVVGAGRHVRRMLMIILLVMGESAHPAPAAAAAAELTLAGPLEVRNVLALVLSCSAAGIWAENNTRIGSMVSGAMTTFALAMLLSGLGFLPSSPTHPVYEMIWTHVIPLAIVQLLLSLDKNTIITAVHQSSGMLKAFALASVGTLLGSITAFKLLAFAIPDAWQFAAVFSATYVGGTMNFLATADAVRLRDPISLATAFSAGT